MISQTTEYALRAAVYLADNREQAQTLPAIAEATAVPSGYLSKVLQTLRRAGVVESRRGKKGGFTLARNPEEFSLYDVVGAVRPLSHVEVCPLTDSSDCPQLGFGRPIPGLCPLHKMLRGMSSSLEERFRAFTLAQVLEGSLDGGLDNFGGPAG